MRKPLAHTARMKLFKICRDPDFGRKGAVLIVAPDAKSAFDIANCYEPVTEWKKPVEMLGITTSRTSPGILHNDYEP